MPKQETVSQKHFRLARQAAKRVPDAKRKNQCILTCLHHLKLALESID
jgi:hypothetical protein